MSELKYRKEFCPDCKKEMSKDSLIVGNKRYSHYICQCGYESNLTIELCTIVYPDYDKSIKQIYEKRGK